RVLRRGDRGAGAFAGGQVARLADRRVAGAVATVAVDAEAARALAIAVAGDARLAGVAHLAARRARAVAGVGAVHVGRARPVGALADVVARVVAAGGAAARV